MSELQFDRKAAHYHDAAFVQRDLATWAAPMLPKPSAQGPVLELGAGSGLWTNHLLSLGHEVQATDASAEMVKHGQHFAPKARWSQLDAWDGTQKQDIAALSSSALLQWCPAPASCFRRWRQWLPPGGWMAHAFFVEPCLQELADCLPSALAWRSPQAWSEAATEAGWQDVHLHTQPYTATFPDSLALLRWLHRTGAVSRQPRLSGARLRALCTALDQRLATASGLQTRWTFALLRAKA